MAYKSDVSSAANGILVDSITVPVTADVQGVKLIDSTTGSGTPIGTAANPLPTSLATLPAADRTTDSIAVAHQTGALMNGLVVLTPKYAAIALTAVTTDQTIVALVAGKKLRVLSLFIVAAGATGLKFRSGTTDITGVMPLAANGGIVLPFSPAGHFETSSGALLAANLSIAFAAGGGLTYVEV